MHCVKVVFASPRWIISLYAVQRVAFDENGGDVVVQDGLDELRDEIHLRLDREDQASVACPDVWADNHE